MKRPVAIFVGFCCVITGIAGLQIITTSFSYFGRGETLRLDPLIWAACAAVTFAINNILLRRSTLIPVLVGANAALFGLSLFVVIVTAHSLSGFFSYLIVVVLIIITVVISYRYSAKTQTLNSQIIVFDVYIILMFWQFFVMGGNMPGDDLPFLLVVLVLNFISNLALRSHEQNVGRALQASPVAGVVFSAGLFVAMFGVIFGFVKLFAIGSRDATAMIFKAIWDGLRYIVGLLGRFFEWLFSLFPYREYEMDITMEAAESVATEQDLDQIQISPEIFYIIAAILALAAIVVLIIVVFRFRKSRLHGGRTAPSAARQPVRRNKSAGRIRNRLMALLRSIVFRIRSLRYINTPPGTLIRLERWGKRRGRARRPGQTMRAYLLSLSTDLMPVADDLDLIHFGLGSGCLTKADCRKIRRDFYKQAKYPVFHWRKRAGESE